MSRFPRLIAAVAVTILLAACGQAGDNPVGPAGPSLDSGTLTGGGNYSDSTSTATTDGSGDTSTADAGGTPTGGGN